MITPAYCVTMARYNTWQNRQIARAMDKLDEAALTQDRGAFFGSILATANHLLWGDRTWMARFGVGEAPGGRPRDGATLTPTHAVWYSERYRMDGQIEIWAERQSSVDLTGNLTWYSPAAGREMSKPVGLCVAHMFNHQTHHRGQIHAMLTAAGVDPGDTDLFLMPDPS
ncbi:damage-inducible protein DinB [Oceanicola sp. 22II-s10i]|uniref:DinB family protein n=1 Tax=Oceanicola sp. 22II-s10i TaxID=1317116 RepID=UPI000B527234|nr:DinB family protein [Oceanicola sp. 22II-s10i]OWU83459.1 damage-inducible protein DinB [Oceanicola sp. 22II-s10i]